MAVALITGASQGIGACIAKRLAKDGFDVVINYYPSESSKEKALAVAAECEAFGVKALCIGADVSQFDQCEAMVKQVKAEFGSIDALVNNAGITKDTLLARMKEEDYDAVIAVNQKNIPVCLQWISDSSRKTVPEQKFSDKIAEKTAYNLNHKRKISGKKEGKSHFFSGNDLYFPENGLYYCSCLWNQQHIWEI